VILQNNNHPDFQPSNTIDQNRYKITKKYENPINFYRKNHAVYRIINDFGRDLTKFNISWLLFRGYWLLVIGYAPQPMWALRLKFNQNLI
jgi:hypothetical protein